jgi:hypothetical protein
VDVKDFLRKNFSNLDSFSEESFRDRLFSLRFPKIAAIRKNREEALKSISLPSGVSITLDSSLEDPKAVLKLEFSSPDGLNKHLSRLQALAASDPSFAKIFEEDWDAV